MTIRIFSSLLLFQLFVSSQASAADERGNGGDAVVCRDDIGNIISAETLDHFEARVILSLPLNLGGLVQTKPGGVSQEVLEIVKNIINRIPEFDKNRRELYTDQASYFEREALFLSGVSLRDIPDSETDAIPHNCSVEQVAIHRTPEYPGEKRYKISRDIWDAMDSDSQVTLILHELIYRQSSMSRRARYLTGRIISEDFMSISDLEYAGLMELLNFDITKECFEFSYIVGNPQLAGYHRYESVRPCFIPGTVKYDQNGILLEGILTQSSVMLPHRNGRFSGQMKLQYVKVHGHVVFKRDSNKDFWLQRATLSEDQEIMWDAYGCGRNYCKKSFSKGTEIAFNEYGLPPL